MSDDDLKKQYREFLKRLEESTRQYSIEQLREIDPKDILKLFFEPESDLFVDIEMVMQAISVCCVKISCELYWNLFCRFSRTILIPGGI